MRLVFDTNVLFAAPILRAEHAQLATATLLTSEIILREFEEKLVLKGSAE